MKARKLVNLSVLATLLVVGLLVGGCKSLYTGVVTVTTVVDGTMKTWADLSDRGKTTPAIDQKVVAYHDRYRASCLVAKSALEAYKASGDPATYNQAIAAARQAANDLIDVIAPLLTPAQATDVRTQLANAKTL